MRSHLTRNVFRRILANEPIVHARCLHRQCQHSISGSSTTRACESRRTPPIYANGQQRRSLGGLNFNIFAKKQQSAEADMEAGIDKMMELAKRERMQARMPPLHEVTLAIRQLFQSKRRKKSNLTDTEAQLASQSLRYVFLTMEGGVDNERTLHDLFSEETVVTMAKVLRVKSPSLGQAHSELARLLVENVPASPKARIALFQTRIRLLSLTGHTEQARDLVITEEQALSNAPPRPLPLDRHEENDLVDESIDEGVAIEKAEPEPVYGPLAAIWEFLLQGFVREDNEQEVRRALAIIEERGLVRASTALAMISFSLQRGDVTALKKWWTLCRQHALSRPAYAALTARELRKVLIWCLANDQMETGHEIVRDVTVSNPPKVFWDAVFIWAAGTTKSVDEIDRMMTVMEQSNAWADKFEEKRCPDITTINHLVEYAVSINDPYMAERFIALGRERNIEADARTFVLQMEYRLNVEDVDGALVAYKTLQSYDTSQMEDVPAVNRLIVALCKTNRHDFETIMDVAADLSDRQAQFDADTVAALSILHLSRAEEDDVIDLLNTHAFHYSSTERAGLRNAILAFCLAPGTPSGNAWMAYTTLRDIFDELSREERTELMNSFFDRERSDMAVHVFQNMRRHTRADTIPTIDTYVSAFIGLAKARELEGLEVVHNQLKLDFNITPDTRLHNALLIAYTACGEARNALTFWEDIVASREGPTYNSIHAALRACEKSAFGDERAKKIWGLLRKRNVDLDESLWASYIAALAGNGNLEDAINTMEEAARKGELEVDWFMLGSLQHVTAGRTKQADLEAYAKKLYPEEWEKLEAMGMEVDDWGVGKFKIDRKIGP